MHLVHPILSIPASIISWFSELQFVWTRRSASLHNMEIFRRAVEPPGDALVSSLCKRQPCRPQTGTHDGRHACRYSSLGRDGARPSIKCRFPAFLRDSLPSRQIKCGIWIAGFGFASVQQQTGQQLSRRRSHRSRPKDNEPQLSCGMTRLRAE